MQNIGNFEVVSGQVRVTDPCYDVDTWCAGELPAVNGRWQAYIEKGDTDADWGERVLRILVHHESLPFPITRPDWQAVPFHVGVDSGQAGVFDSSHYKDDALAVGMSYKREDGPLCPDEPWYSLCCDSTLSEEHAGVIPFGAVSSSGYGDGGYSAYYICDEDGNALAIEIVFIDEGDEDGDAPP